MPRHRIETPRSRTLWPAAVQSARRVPLSAAGRRVTPGHAKPAVVPEWRQRLTRNQRRMLKQAGRRLLVSPWFAAGAGVVIATGAIIYTPHASLDFGNAIHVIHCSQAQCRHETPSGAAPGLLAGTGGGPVTRPSHTPSVIAGMTFRYQVLNENQYGFSMLITIHATRSIGEWELSFVVPGARGVYVVGALWQRSGPDGGTASNYVVGTESAGYARIFAAQRNDSDGSSRYADTVQFTVHGTGAPSRPTKCSFNGAACQFTLLEPSDGASWAGP